MLVLAVVGGFGVWEIAAAFVSSHAAIEKRLTRAKHRLKESTLFDIADAADFATRLPAVQRALYLIFSEGYHGASPQAVVRGDLCHEAIRLTRLLAKHPLAAAPSMNPEMLCVSPSSVSVPAGGVAASGSSRDAAARRFDSQPACPRLTAGAACGGGVCGVEGA